MIVQQRERTLMHSLEFPWMADEHLVRRLTESASRPNLLVLTGDRDQEAFLASLAASCRRPFHFCRPPEALRLPVERRGTVFLIDPGRMTLRQQITLHDWMGEGAQQTQIVSLAPRPLFPLVASGEFLEALYYRLNVVSVAAREE
jgi:hypothetical protein